MARWTASRLSRLTWGALLSTREAAERETPARSATSSSVGLRRGVCVMGGHSSSLAQAAGNDWERFQFSGALAAHAPR